MYIENLITTNNNNNVRGHWGPVSGSKNSLRIPTLQGVNFWNAVGYMSAFLCYFY